MSQAVCLLPVQGAMQALADPLRQYAIGSMLGAQPRTTHKSSSGDRYLKVERLRAGLDGSAGVIKKDGPAEASHCSGRTLDTKLRSVRKQVEGEDYHTHGRASPSQAFSGPVEHFPQKRALMHCQLGQHHAAHNPKNISELCLLRLCRHVRQKLPPGAFCLSRTAPTIASVADREGRQGAHERIWTEFLISIDMRIRHMHQRVTTRVTIPKLSVTTRPPFNLRTAATTHCRCEDPGFGQFPASVTSACLRATPQSYKTTHMACGRLQLQSLIASQDSSIALSKKHQRLLCLMYQSSVMGVHAAILALFESHLKPMLTVWCESCGTMAGRLP